MRFTGVVVASAALMLATSSCGVPLRSCSTRPGGAMELLCLIDVCCLSSVELGCEEYRRHSRVLLNH